MKCSIVRFVFLSLVALFFVVVDAAASKDAEICSRVFDVSNRTIIKTTESLNLGAKYLQSTKAKTRAECMLACCSLNSCNMAVLQEKVDGDCYLFDCGSLDDFKCKFSSHDEHVAMGMMVNRNDYQKTQVHEQAKHEMDLNLLKTQTDIKQQQQQIDQQQQQQRQPVQSKVNSQQQVNPQDSMAEPEPQQDFGYNSGQQQQQQPSMNKASGKKMQSVGDDGSTKVQQPSQYDSVDDDRPSLKSGNQNLANKPKSILNKNVAKPQRPFNSQTFNKKPSIPSGLCSKTQWQCENSWECIAVYDKCDGIAQCSDKSDEKNCDVKPNDAGNGQQQQVYAENTPPPLWGQYYPPDQAPQISDGSNADRQRDRLQQNRPINNNDYQNYDSSGSMQNNGNNGWRMDPQAQNPNVDTSNDSPNRNFNKTPQKSLQPQQQMSNNNGKNVQQQNGGQQQRVVNSQIQSGSASDQQQRVPDTNVVKQQPVATVTVTAVATGEDAVDVSEHLDYGRGSTSLAAVMLGLGLAILALLLLFISCRLRTARRRLRRGKVLDTDEGEYLINGMYL